MTASDAMHGRHARPAVHQRAGWVDVALETWVALVAVGLITLIAVAGWSA